MATFGINSAFLFAIWGGGILWGVFTCVFTYALYVLWRAHIKSEGYRSRYISGITIVILYLLATVYLCIDVSQAYVGLIQTPLDQQIDFFFGKSGGVKIAKNFVYLFSMWISDGVVVWRCYAIWNYNKYIIALPVLLLCMTIASGTIGESQFLVPVPSISNAGNWGTALYAVSLTLNTGTTILTAGRLWYLASALAVPGEKMKQRYRTIILTIIDSGAAMAAARVVEFVLFMFAPAGPVGNNAFYTVTDLLPQISGIVPTAIVVVVHARRGAIETYRDTIAGAHSIAFQPRTVTTDTYDLEQSSGFTTDGRGVNVGFIMGQTDTRGFESGHLCTDLTASSGTDTKQD